MQRTHVLLNIIYIQADPPPKGGGFTDPLLGTLKSCVTILLTTEAQSTQRSFVKKSYANNDKQNPGVLAYAILINTRSLCSLCLRGE